jgi:hypothetical protein
VISVKWYGCAGAANPIANGARGRAATASAEKRHRERASSSESYAETPYFFRLHDLCICDPAGVRRGGPALFVEILGDAG